MKILLVEDDPVALAVLEEFVITLGHEVATATDGWEAWTLLGREPIRVVVCDWTMPNMDGLDLCRRIRDSGEEYVYFILLTSAAGSNQNRDQALHAGIDDFLSKPIEIQDLKMRLHVAERILHFTTHIRQLESFIPICSYCKNVRDDQSYWQQIESYIGNRTGSKFSHSVCPACHEKYVEPQLRALKIAHAISGPEVARPVPAREFDSAS